MTYQLTVKSGLVKGSSWIIEDRPIVVGRGSTCDVRIPDQIVSRRHFELSCQDDVLHFQDLGGLNAVLINGSPSCSCTLSVGDEIRLGRYAFFITRNANGDDSGVCSSEYISADTLAEEQSVYLSSRKGSDESQVAPKTDADLNDLFYVSRVFSRLTTVSALVESLKEHIQKRFQPDRGWLLFSSVRGNETIPLVDSEEMTKSGIPSATRERMMAAFAERRGTLTSMRIRQDNRDNVVCVLTTPIALGDLQIGVLALEREAQSQAYQKDELHFLVALAHIVAPFFKAIERIEDLEAENRRLRYAEEKQAMMVGSSKVMARLHRTIRIVAPSVQPVLVLGQTGTGKELVASLLHELSNRSDGPFVTVNCAAIPRELFESEFFGYEKGAFTGALQRKTGMMEQSDGGTLFLDEIGDLSSEHQARILRAVESGRFRRIGGKEEIAVNVRIVAATNKDLAFEIQEGTFREDLYHRLRAVEIQVPPLSQRIGDIPELAAYFLEMACIRAKRTLQRLSPQAIEYLMERSWPGNVRQLRNVIETANTFCRTDVIDVNDLPAMLSGEDAKNKPLSLDEMERQHLAKTLEYTDGNILQTAKILGIGRSTLYVKLAQYGLK